MFVFIGRNVYEVFIFFEVKKGELNELYVIRFCFGWSIFGGFVMCS